MLITPETLRIHKCLQMQMQMRILDRLKIIKTHSLFQIQLMHSINRHINSIFKDRSVIRTSRVTQLIIVSPIDPYYQFP